LLAVGSTDPVYTTVKSTHFAVFAPESYANPLAQAHPFKNAFSTLSSDV